MRVLVTGAAGFIGAELTRHILVETDWDVVVIDSFRHRGKTDRLTAMVGGQRAADHLGDRLTVVMHDLAVPVSCQMDLRLGRFDAIFALASGSHVGASLEFPRSFVENNVAVALTTLEYARDATDHLIWVSTDEVYGPCELNQVHQEWDAIIPSNPYSASKAAQEALAVAWWRSYGLPVTIVNMQNAYGPLQGAEKFIPLVMAAIRDGRKVKVHGSAGQPGSRCWLHVSDIAAALTHIAGSLPPVRFSEGAGRPSRWNIAGGGRASNFEVAALVAEELGKDLEWEWSDDRPGRDPHYALDWTALGAEGWKPVVPLARGIAETVQWTMKHPEWLHQ